MTTIYPSKRKKNELQFTDRHRREFKELEENCFRHLHKPRVVKVTNWPDEIFYICKECLDNYMRDHQELQEIIISFGR